MLPSGLYEVEGSGVEYASSSDTKNLQQCWSNWGELITQAAELYQVPAAWILAIMTVETGLWSNNPSKQATIVSPAGAIGLMQVMPQTARGLGFSPLEMSDPWPNISAGTKLISQLMAQGLDLPGITAKYNSGGLCSTGRNVFNLRTDSVAGNPYPRMAMQVNNSALTLLEKPQGSSVATLGLALLGVGAGLIFFGGGGAQVLRWVEHHRRFTSL